MRLMSLRWCLCVQNWNKTLMFSLTKTRLKVLWYVNIIYYWIVYFLIIFFIYIITVLFLSVVVGIKSIGILHATDIGLPKLRSNFLFYYYLLYTLLYFTTRSRKGNIVPSLWYLASTLNVSLLHQKLLIFSLLCWNFLFLINSDTSWCIYFFF